MKKMKEIFNLDNLPIIVLIIIIIAAISVIIWNYGLKDKVIKEPISMEEARTKAVEVFEELGEKNIKSETFEILKTSRDGVEYFYISSKENTVEIIINGGKINRINSVYVDE